MPLIRSLIKFTLYFNISMMPTTPKYRIFKQTLLLVLLILPLSVPAAAKATASGEIPQAIFDALKAGNSIQLSRYFNTSIELAIPEKEDIYSSQQAELIIKDFFSKHVPSNFTVLHKGGKDGSQYAIGNLTTSNGNFRVTLLIKIRDNKPYIHQLRFEQENGA
jgi:hypothetical protein